MKALVIYWLIGCVVIGGAIGVHAARCPSDATPPLSNILAGVTIWPALLISAIGVSAPPKVCAITDSTTKDSDGDSRG